MIAIARADDVRLISDGEGGWISVPDLKIPGHIKWGAYKSDHGDAFFIHFETDTKEATTLWHGPHVIGGNTYYIIDAPRRVLQALKNQLGAANVAPLIKALRVRPALRAYLKAAGYRLVRNSSGNPVTILPPLVICGTNPVDLDGDELDDADELLDLED